MPKVSKELVIGLALGYFVMPFVVGKIRGAVKPASK